MQCGACLWSAFCGSVLFPSFSFSPFLHFLGCCLSFSRLLLNIYILLPFLAYIAVLQERESESERETIASTDPLHLHVPTLLPPSLLPLLLLPLGRSAVPLPTQNRKPIVPPYRHRRPMGKHVLRKSRLTRRGALDRNLHVSLDVDEGLSRFDVEVREDVGGGVGRGLALLGGGEGGRVEADGGGGGCAADVDYGRKEH